MGRIKSALEIALERTESVTSNKSSIGQFEAKQNGKRLANDFLKGMLKSLDEELKKASEDELPSLKQGLFDIFISQITLPASKEDLKRVETAGQGLKSIIANKRSGEITRQMVQILNQYLDEAVHYEEAIKKQYAPKLRQKEEELSRRFGRQVRLDPFQDPEFAAFFNQNMNALKANYEGTISEIREETRQLFESPGN